MWLFSNENIEILISSFWSMLKGAIFYTIPLALISFFLGLLIALFCAVVKTYTMNQIKHPITYVRDDIDISYLRQSCYKLLVWLINVYISLVRGTPLLVQLFIIFYGLPALEIQFSPFISAIIAFSLNVGAYAAETIRAGILSIHKMQWEAAFSIGLTRLQMFVYIILPQMFRVVIPPLSNSFISLVKDTSLASVVMIVELFRVAQNIAASNYNFLLIYSEAAAIYWIICLFLSYLQFYLECYLEKKYY